MNRIYEEMFIVRPDVPEEEMTPFIEQVKSVITAAGGTIDKEDRMGMRRLAYAIEKRNEGFYVLLQFTASPTVVREVERRLRVSDMVMKFITVRIDEKLKVAAKLKKKKDARAARKPAVQAPAAPAPISFAEAPASLPGAPMPGAPAPAAPLPAPPVPEAPEAPEAREVPEAPESTPTPEEGQ